MKTRDVMTTKVMSIPPDAPIRNVAEFLVDNRISAAPVIARTGTPLGVVSEGDLLRRIELGTEPHRAWWTTLLADPDDEARSFVKSRGLVAADVMTRGVIAVSPDAELAEIAALLEEKRIKRAFVMEAGKIVGVVTRSDLVRTLARRRAPESVHRGDAAIRADIEREMRAQPWAPNAFVSITVKDGQVELVGAVDSEVQREGMNLLAQRVEGVQGVADHLVVRKPGASWATHAI
jgi:CBS domain-containing protein